MIHVNIILKKIVVEDKRNFKIELTYFVHETWEYLSMLNHRKYLGHNPGKNLNILKWH